MKVGRKIYYDITSGDVIFDTGEHEGFVRETTIEQDITIYKVLSERNRETFDYIKLEYGQYEQDFSECNGYRVNVETKQLEFSYPNPSEPIAPIVYQKPLTEEIEELKAAQATTDTTLLELMETILV